MNKNNQTLKEIFVSAMESYKKKNHNNAEILCYKILSIDPYHFDSLYLLANLSVIKGDFDEAKKLLEKSIEIQPKNANAIHNLGTTYKELGKFNEAITIYKKVLEIDPTHTNAHYNLGLTFYKLKNLRRAKSYFKKTVEIQNNYALAFFCLANVHVDLKEFESAVSCYQKAIKLKPDLVTAYNNLGLAYRGLNDFSNAIENYEKAIKIKPDHVGAHHNLAQAFKEKGDFKKAINSYQTAIKHEPENLSHYNFLSELKKDILDLTLKQKIEKIIKNKKCTKRTLAYGNYLLAKYERKEKNYEKEINFLIEGHQNFFDSDKKRFDLGIKYCFDDALQISEKVTVENDHKKDENQIEPIFIIGVPRCGSTLVEKIIGSGKKIIPLGEETTVLEDFVNKNILEKKSLNIGYSSIVKKELFEIYKTRGLISKKCNYIFTEKSLNNFFYLNLIKEIYPNAKIINCNRDILSSVMSIFQNNLTELAWCHNLENIFKYFNNYFEIIKNFNKLNPGMIYELKFEELIDKPEEESKKIMQFCELPWDIQCLEFYKRKNLISKTASNIQIREGIYKHSLDRYLPYKKFLYKYAKQYAWFNSQ